MINDKTEMNDTLSRLQTTLVEILNEIDRVCTENHICYSITYGTLLGAIRHCGFIPWDDDVDVMMPRADYERFLEIWDQCAKPGYLLDHEKLTDDYVNNFAKIRKDHTTCLLYESERKAKHHKGIYVDVFPADRFAPGKVTRGLQFAALAVNLLYNRGYVSDTGGMIGAIEKFLLAVTPRKWYRRISDAAGVVGRSWNDHTEQEYILPCTIVSCRKHYPANMFDRMTLLRFGDREYSAISEHDAFLRVEYGDYMTLPPVEERVWVHHPLLIDFEHNYEELN